MKHFKPFIYLLLSGIFLLFSFLSCTEEKAVTQELGYLNVNPEDLPPLYKLAYTGRIDLIKQLMAEQPEEMADPDNLWECLIGAICGERKELIKYLLPKMKDVDLNKGTESQRFWYYYSGIPFDYALETGNTDIIALLVEYGADIHGNVTDPYRSTPLSMVAGNGDLATVRFLLKKGTDVNAGYEPPLNRAIIGGNKEIIRLLLKHGADVNLRIAGLHDGYTYDGNTPLCLAIKNEDTETARLLLAKGADVNQRGKAGWLPLHHAINEENKEIAQLLIQSGADINAIVNHSLGQLTPLWLAVHSGNRDLVDLLLEQGATLQDTPSLLLAATYSGEWELFQFLMDKVDAPNAFERSRMWEAALEKDNLEVARYLLETGDIDVNKKIGNYLRLPLGLVAANAGLQGEEAERNRHLLTWLIEKGAKPELINEGKVMDWVMRNSNPETFDYFLALGFPFKIETGVPVHPYSSPFIDAFMNTIDWGDFYSHAARYLLQQADSDSGYPIIVHCANDYRLQYPVMEFLVEEKVNVAYFPYAFLRCVWYNDFELIPLFLRNGVDINTKNKQGKNALWYVSDPEMAEYLIKRGIDVSIPLVYEGELIDMSVLSVFVKWGIPIRLSQEYLDEALRMASHIGDSKLVDYFLDKGANVNARGKKTPLMENASKGYLRPSGRYETHRRVSPKVIKQLVKAGADIDAEDENGDTALMHAVRHYEYSDEYIRRIDGIIERYSYPEQNYSLIVQELLRAGADVNKVNKQGETALSLAIKDGRTELIPILEEYGAVK